MDDEQLLSGELTKLCRAGQLPLSQVEVSTETLNRLGFVLEGTDVRCPTDLEWLDPELIRSALSGRARLWLQELNVYKLVGSTSTMLLERARTESIDGVVNTAELQIAGRGRRGKQWQSPIGQNLAVSVGLVLPVQPVAMGGFSLCVGLALLDLLQNAGVIGLELKWPNDLLLNGGKLAGVLIDLNKHESGCEVVVGIGLNLKLPAQAKVGIDQPVADLGSCGVSFSRNWLIGSLLSSLLDYVDGFCAQGFAPMRSQFDQNHRFHGHECLLLQGQNSIVGVVKGVTNSGELLLQTTAGERVFSSGEVSLRQRL